MPQYGFFAEAPGGLFAGSVLVGGRHIAFSRSPERFFFDVRDGRGTMEFWAVKSARATFLEFPAGAKEMQITPPRTYKTPYTVWIDLAKLWRADAGVKAVCAENVDVPVDWALKDGVLKVTVPAMAFRCVVVWCTSAGV